MRVGAVLGVSAIAVMLSIPGCECRSDTPADASIAIPDGWLARDACLVPETSVRSAVDQLVRAMCEGLITCSYDVPYASPAEVDDCAQYLSRSHPWLRVLDANINRIEVDERNLLSCANALRGICSREPYSSGLLNQHGCFDVFHTPCSQEASGECRFTHDCPRGMYCERTAASCSLGSCTRQPRLGEPCSSHCTPSGEPLICSGYPARCLRLLRTRSAGIGETCWSQEVGLELRVRACDIGLQCLEGVCRAPGEEGDPCSACVGSGSCLPCSSGLYCGPDERCAPRPGLRQGDPCTDTLDCGVYWGLICDRDGERCVDWAGTFGQPCDEFTAHCARGLSCVEGECLPSVGSSGAACATETDCASGCCLEGVCL